MSLSWLQGLGNTWYCDIGILSRQRNDDKHSWNFYVLPWYSGSVDSEEINSILASVSDEDSAAARKAVETSYRSKLVQSA